MALVTKSLLLVFLLNVVSAVLFIAFVNRPVYDDPYNMSDVRNYASQGVSTETLLAHRNAPGPTAFIWMSAAVRLLGGNELRDARIGALCSWLLLFVGIFLGARASRFQSIWFGALLVLLVFPHSVEAMATVLTEGPALLFAIFGLFVWIEFAVPATNGVRPLLAGMSGALLMGLAITCRQYFLALLPATAILALYLSRTVPPSERFRWLARALLSLVVAVAPVVVMVAIWKGISSPGMATATSYNNVWKATVGLNLSRPLIVLFYLAIYLVPLTFPLAFRLQRNQRRIAFLIAVLGGFTANHFSHLFLQPGPLKSLIQIASRLPYGGVLLFVLIAIVAIYNAAATCFQIWESRFSLLSCTPALFSLLFVLFFVVQQLGVGGNIPFYDRYVLQVAPFFGCLAFALQPKLTMPRLFALASLSALSHFMLWRYAFA